MSAYALVAGAAWATSVGTLVAFMVLDIALLGPLATLIAVVAMTVTVRYWISQQSTFMRNAFDLGRDAAQGERGRMQSVR